MRRVGLIEECWFSIGVKYDRGLVAAFKTLTPRSFDRQTKRWHFPMRLLNDVARALSLHGYVLSSNRAFEFFWKASP